MLFGKFDQDGKPLAFYDDEINTSIPQDVVEITKAQWEELMSDQNMKRFVGGVVITRTKTQAELDREALMAKRQELQNLLEGVDNKFLFRVIMEMGEALIANGALNGNQFSPPVKAAYQQIKALKEELYPNV